MCHYVTVGVPAEKAGYLEQAIPRGLVADPTANHSIARHLPKDYRTYLVTSGMCSCDLFRRPVGPVEQEAHRKKFHKKYQKRGWSKAKIERAMAQAASKAPAVTFSGLRPDLREGLADLVGKTRELAIVVHWYNGLVETEQVPIGEAESVDVEPFRSGQVPVQEDQLLFVQPPRHASAASVTESTRP